MCPGEPTSERQIPDGCHERSFALVPVRQVGDGGYVALVRIAFGTDECTEVTDRVQSVLRERGHDVVSVADGIEWPDAGRRVGEAVASGEAERGVVCCWTGTGVSIAANKVAGVRAALCTDAETARGARRWNDANVLAFGLRLITPAVAEEMLDAFLSTDPDPDEAATIDTLEPGVLRRGM
jgi:ribose 5-phosphate isomerase B